MCGFIKIHRSITEWEWYKDINTKVLFLHLIFTANYENKRWQGIEIKRGQLVSSITNLAESTTLTFQQVRTALDKLKTTGEITIKTTNRFTLLTLTNYALYQDDRREINTQNSEQSNKQITNKQQTDNKQITTTKEVKEIKNISIPSNEVIDIDPNPKKFQKPTIAEIQSFCQIRKNSVDADKFFNYYESKGWIVGKSPMKNWQSAIVNWEKNSFANTSQTSSKPSGYPKPQYDNPDYYANTGSFYD